MLSVPGLMAWMHGSRSPARREPVPPQIVVPPLNMEEREEIVVQQLSEYRKKLTPTQLQLLLEKAESHKPLFLLTCCEELRLQVRAPL